MSSLQQPVINDQGERVIPGTRRPDGTVRKERRIREGYTPQDEVKAYQSRGTLAKQNIPKCPGMDDAEVEALAQKAQKKPAAKKDKPTPPAGASNAPKQSAPKAQPAPAPAPAAPSAPEDPPEVVLEKKARTLKKKLRECEALQAKKDAGTELNQPESEKLSKAAAWQKELEEMEKQLAALST